jgi:hypothetical protein
MKIYGEWTSVLDGGEWSASLPGRFTPGTHWIGGWVGSRAGLDAVNKTVACIKPISRQIKRLETNQGNGQSPKL